MGEDSPPDFPDILNAKWYYATIQCYLDDENPPDCSMNYWMDFSGCISGQRINDWRAAGGSCDAFNPLFLALYYTATRLIGCIGPYDNAAACAAAHP